LDSQPHRRQLALTLVPWRAGAPVAQFPDHVSDGHRHPDVAADYDGDDPPSQKYQAGRIAPVSQAIDDHFASVAGSKPLDRNSVPFGGGAVGIEIDGRAAASGIVFRK
jgi:hypothetical protein